MANRVSVILDHLTTSGIPKQIVDNLYWLDQIQPSQRSLVGEKAFGLSQLGQQGYPVIRGFVIPAIAFWQVIADLSQSEPLLADLPQSSLYVNVDNPRQLQQVAQHIRQVITSATVSDGWRSHILEAGSTLDAPALILQPSVSFPEVRSRTPMSTHPVNREDWAEFAPIPELLASHYCRKQPDALIQTLKQVWAELFRAKSLFYWQRVGMGLDQINLAVLVQPIYDTLASGVLQAKSDFCQIQATWGLGIAITQGKVLPDTYQIAIPTDQLLLSQPGNKTLAYRLNPEPTGNAVQAYPLSQGEQQQSVLDDNAWQQIMALSRKLQTQFNLPFSFDWTLCKIPNTTEPQLYVTQFRPQSASSAESFPSQPQSLRGLSAASGQVTAVAQVMIGEEQNWQAIPPDRILVTQTIAPDWLPILRQAAGVVTEQGGMTSHAAIVARELGIPAVVNVPGITQLVQTGEVLLVDGDRGEIQRLARDAKQLGEAVDVAIEKQETVADAPSPRQYNRFPIATQLLVNLSQTQSLERIRDLPIDGIGLLRSELMILDVLNNQPPQEWLRQGRKQELITRLAQLIMQFAAALMPRPVFYRSLDWGEAELIHGDTSNVNGSTLSVVNAMLGRRGTYRYLHDPTSFDLELAALHQLYAQGYSNVQLMLPFVRTVEEFVFCRRRVEQAGLMDNPHFQLWIMAEVPSILFLLPDYVKAGVQGISIGTNDLTQLLLAADRNLGELGSTLDGRHPAVMGAIKQLIDMAKGAGIPCAICGQAPAQYPEVVESLVEWGIQSISVDVSDVEATYHAIARAEQRLLLEAARRSLDG
ncbi:PEP-utilizing enzyme, TIM barrel domain protein [Coleofasciculus chthonoplastes PCC 7420]|uniref:Phosphoenolpyruvate synthase n=1 Tax=Coleofasciculus chthonoplastes PCC 7420 TaxID=118168 RepID=B4VYV1_9CYAN|nr:putative PEP-binding protein [Coleofasciculus chthonoplastes]EDX72871.1 PEP-utilizing enzyme, TIM barrel domain protein [Coleofasciculus chthonoplastes PCC 7420]